MTAGEQVEVRLLDGVADETAAAADEELVEEADEEVEEDTEETEDMEDTEELIEDVDEEPLVLKSKHWLIQEAI